MPQTPLLTVLGPVRVGGADPGGSLARALVIALALSEAHTPRSTESLADDLWGEDQPKHPKAALQSLISRLRHSVGDIIVTQAGGYALAGGDPATGSGQALSDLAIARAAARSLAAREPQRHGTAAFGTGLVAAPLTRTATTAAPPNTGETGKTSPTSPTACLTLVDNALAFWRGDPGADASGTPAAAELAQAAAALHTTLSQQRAAILLELGRALEAAAAIRALAAARPHDERVHLDLMTALTRGGERGEALEVFTAFRTQLRDELGVSPGRDFLEAGAELLREQELAEAPQQRIGVRSETASLFGRDRDLARLAALLREHRLVTVLGPGGLGKTRIAHALAAASPEPLVVVVSLASVRADDDVAPAIAAALGVHEASTSTRITEVHNRPELRSLVLAAIGDRPTLLVLDNCEQIVDGVAAWCGDMLASAPKLRVLATSRTPLGLPGEQAYPLSALAVAQAERDAQGESISDPASYGPAVQLFVERARSARPGAILPLDTVARLCQHLDGLPLAIELAAARIRTMTPAQIEDRLRDRFALLRNADRTAPERHRTLEAVIEWSWDLLDADAREALTILAVLPNGFSAQTAAAMLSASGTCAGPFETDDLLDRLVAQSLLVVVDSPGAEGLRFRMLETVREFGLSRLRLAGTEAVAESAMLTWACEFVQDLGPRASGVPGALGPAAFRMVRAEQENLLTALRVAIREQHDSAIVLSLAALAQSWMVRGAFTEFAQTAAEVSDAITHAAVHSPDVHPDALALCLAACAVGLAQGHPRRALRSLAHLRRLRRTNPQLRPLWSGISLVFESGLESEAVTAPLAELRHNSDPDARLLGELFTSQLAENDGELEIARAAAERTWRLAEQQGERWIAAMSARSLAELASQSAKPAEAMRWLDLVRTELAAFGIEAEEDEQAAWLRGTVLVCLGQLDEAEAVFRELTRIPRKPSESHDFAPLGWYGLAEVLRARGETVEAAAMFEHALTTFREQGPESSPWQLLFLGEFVAAVSLDESLAAASAAKWAQRLRGRTLAVQRILTTQVDRPVLGSAITGWAAWAIGIPELRERGIELLALAEVLGARQDQPGLVLSLHWKRVEALAGPAAVAAARQRARALPGQERVPLARTLLAAPVNVSP